MTFAHRFDPGVAEEARLALVIQMERLGVRTTLHWHPGGHELARPELEAAMGWLGLA
jgi:predicted esterase